MGKLTFEFGALAFCLSVSPAPFDLWPDVARKEAFLLGGGHLGTSLHLLRLDLLLSKAECLWLDSLQFSKNMLSGPSHLHATVRYPAQPMSGAVDPKMY